MGCEVCVSGEEGGWSGREWDVRCEWGEGGWSGCEWGVRSVEWVSGV